jgi:hypothetical protein
MTGASLTAVVAVLLAGVLTPKPAGVTPAAADGC